MTAMGENQRPLTSREREVLTTIVESYVATGKPVASRALARSNSEELSAASIRNIVADLQEAGYVAHPHSSAGGVPTDQGYRCYVDSIGPAGHLAGAERDQLANELFATGGLDSLVSRCCRLLSVASGAVAVGTAPGLDTTVFRHVEFVKLAETKLLVLFITDAGVVRQEVIDVDARDDQANLAQQARYLCSELKGRTLPEVRDHIAHLMSEERVRYDELARRALMIGERYFVDGSGTDTKLHVDGTERLLSEPPSAEHFDRMKSLIRALEDKHRILELLDRCITTEGVVTRIGTEIESPELANYSLVASNYSLDETRLGSIGILGPTRMDYDRAMALVDYVSQLLGNAHGGARS